MNSLKFSPDQLDDLAQTIDIYRPSGLNDDKRIDLTHQPFLTIDRYGAHEIDDAIQVTRHRGGSFTVRTAIADGGQLSGQTVILDEAIKKNFNKYDTDGRPKRSILSPNVTRDLELSSGVRRALVVSQTFSADTSHVSNAEIIPARVRAQAVNFRNFGVSLKVGVAGSMERVVADFEKVYKLERGIRYVPPEGIDSPKKAREFSRDVVQTYMILANMAVAGWSAQRDVSVFYRQLRSGFDHWNHTATVSGESQSSDNTSTTKPCPTLSKQPYMRMTSPLRRASDLINHIQINHYLDGSEAPYTADTLKPLTSQLQ